MVKGKALPLSAEALAHHCLAVTSGADFQVQRAAMEALLRRVASLKAADLEWVARPARNASLGRYRVGRRRSSHKPYTVVVSSLAPPGGSCDCRDFARSSLGLCKHLLAIFAKLSRRPRQQFTNEASARSGPRLTWQPVRPLLGAGDWLERVRWAGEALGQPSLPLARARRHFSAGPGPLSPLLLAHPASAAHRLSMVNDLLSAAGEGRRALEVDPALLPLLEAEKQRLERARAGAELVQALPRLLRQLKAKLYPYQLEGVRRFLETGRLLLADDMGLGKTVQAIASCHALLASGKVDRGLLVVPAALKPQWLREWQQFSAAPIGIVDGTPQERAAAYRRCKKGFLLANYEQVLRDLPLMRRFAPEVVVLDEAQRIKNWAAKTSAYVKQLSPRYRLVLTGTPMENRLDELASLIEWVDDLALEPKWRLAPLHSTPVDGRQEVGGARHLDTLRARLSGCMLRRVRHQVLKQLPSRTDTRLPVPVTPEQQAAHDELSEPIARLIQTSKRRPLTQREFLFLMGLMTKQRIICNGLAQLEFDQTWPSLEAAARPNETLMKGLFSPKLLELRELLANVAVAQGRKVVVFSQWRRMLKLSSWAVSDLLGDAGVRAVFFTGEEGSKRRTQNLVDFHDDPMTRVLFASDAGGVGLNLQKAASCCVNLELPWNPAVLEQRIGRVYRLGQTRPVEIYHLVSDYGIEARIEALVGDKKALFTGLFDGSSDEVQFARSGSFLSRVERVLEPVQAPAAPVQAAPEESNEDDPEHIREQEERQAEVTDAVAPLVEAPAKGSEFVLAERLRQLFTQVEVRPAAAGRVSIEAPAEAAAALAALFEGAAKMLGVAPQPGGPAPRGD